MIRLVHQVLLGVVNIGNAYGTGFLLIEHVLKL